jgi:hypothetical protein
MGMWQTSVKITNVKFYDNPSSGSRVVGTDSLTDWMAGTWWSWSSLFGITLWTHLCALCMCVFVGVVYSFKPIDHFSWNFIWTLSPWSHTHHHNFSELCKLDDNQQCGSYVNVWCWRGSSTTDCRLLKLCVMVCWEKYMRPVGIFKCEVIAWEYSNFCAGATLAPVHCPDVMHVFRSWESIPTFFQQHLCRVYEYSEMETVRYSPFRRGGLARESSEPCVWNLTYRSGSITSSWRR